MKSYSFIIVILITVVFIGGCTERQEMTIDTANVTIQDTNLEEKPLQASDNKTKVKWYNTFPNRASRVKVIGRIEADISSFTDQFDFPKPGGPVVRFYVPGENISFFEYGYGEPKDCENGCVFSNAYGINNNGKIAWIKFNDRDGFDYSNIEMYDYDDSDEYLYTAELFIELQSEDDWIFRAAFLPSVAKDPDTPTDTLLRIAENYLRSGVKSLLENPSVQQNKEILTIIARFAGVIRYEYKVRAKNLLKELE